MNFTTPGIAVVKQYEETMLGLRIPLDYEGVWVKELRFREFIIKLCEDFLELSSENNELRQALHDALSQKEAK